MSKSEIFYDIANDIKGREDYPIFIVMGGRGTGKTYSTLKYMIDTDTKFIFMKRHNDDVRLLCQNFKRGADEDLFIDLSPFKSINRDTGWNIQAFLIEKGLGGFWKCDAENKPVGSPVGYILSLNAVAKFKGFDMSDCDAIVFDEFVPMLYERVNKNEGIALLDLYRTVGRANNILYGKVLKLIMLANPVTVSTPIFYTLNLTDILADMQANGEEEADLVDRGIYIHRIPDINGFREQEAKNPIYKAMRGTRWAKMSLDNDFAYDDFSNVNPHSIRKMSCICMITREEKQWFVYVGSDGYYMSYKRSNTYEAAYDLNKENDQKRFYMEQVIYLQNECISGNMNFETYEMYDVLMNYKTFYKVR